LEPTNNENVRNKLMLRRTRKKFCKVILSFYYLMCTSWYNYCAYMCHIFLRTYTQAVLVMKFLLLSLLVDGRDTHELNKLQKIHLCIGDLRRTFLLLLTFSSSLLASSKRENCNVMWKCSLSTGKPPVASIRTITCRMAS